MFNPRRSACWRICRHPASLVILVLGAAACDSASPTGPDDGAWGDPDFDFGRGAIAFESDRDGNREIYLMTADCTDVTRITNEHAVDRFPAWAPDGTRIAFASDRDGNNEIYVMDATGLNEVRVTQHIGNDTEPVWSADGSRIVFFSTRSGNGDIWSMEPTGADQINLTNDPAFDGAPATGSWSGAEGRISFVSDRAGGNMDIYTMAEDGSDIYRVTTANEMEFDSSWMVEGELLLFDSFRNGNWDIFVVEPSGAATGRLTNHPADDESPVWRPLP